MWYMLYKRINTPAGNKKRDKYRPAEPPKCRPAVLSPLPGLSENKVLAAGEPSGGTTQVSSGRAFPVDRSEREQSTYG